VTLSVGTARLAEQSTPVWHWPSWSYRLPITITNDTGAPLQDFPVRLDLADGPIEVFDLARIDGADLRLTDDSGLIQSPHWIERFDFIARRGALWARIAYLPQGTTTFYLYFGNPDEESPGSAEEVFTYPQPTESMVVASPVASSGVLTIQSFVDGNEVEVHPAGLTWTVDERESVTAQPGDLQMSTIISATGPYSGLFNVDGSDALAPLCHGSQTFVYPSPRHTNVFDMYSPFGTATVEIYDNTTLVDSVTVSTATPVSLTADITDGSSVTIESDLPVVVHHHTSDSGTTNDAMPYLPPALELVGANSGLGQIAALQDNTVVDIYYSEPSHTTVTLDAGDVYTLAREGTNGTGNGDAVHILASAPVAGLAYGDGDGGDAITFMPRDEIGKRYLIPRAAEYVLVSSPQPGVTCDILNSSGQVVDSQTSDTIAPPYPNRLRFSGVPGGSELSCDEPVFAMAEDSATDGERNLWPMKAHRPVVYPSLEVVPSAGVQTRYAATEGTVITPTLEPAGGISGMITFLQTGSTDIPPDTSIRYQLSNNGGATWYYHDGDEWRESVLASQANTAGEIHARATTFPIDSNQLTVQAFLHSDTGTVTPVLDELTIDYAGPGEAIELAFDTIEGTRMAGIPFEITITAVDSDGLPDTSFNGTVELATYGGPVFPPASPAFDQGTVTMEVAVAEVGENVVLRAQRIPLSGESNPFEVVAPTPSVMAIEEMAGDQQVGTTSEPLPVNPSVRVTNIDTGQPMAGISITFAVTEGDGMVSTSTLPANMELEVLTGTDGVAEVEWQMGDTAGANILQARLPGAAGSPVTFEARADPPGTIPGNEEFWASGGGGCDCRAGATSGSPTPSIPLVSLLLALVALTTIALRRQSKRNR
jgi:MYXO-CTERM domain-containing protein